MNELEESFISMGIAAQSAGNVFKRTLMLMDQLRKKRLPRKLKKRLGNDWKLYLK